MKPDILTSTLVSNRDEVLSLVKKLEALLCSELGAETREGAQSDVLIHSEVTNAARKEIFRRAERYQLFPAEIFGEPAWNILLELYLSDKLERSVTVTNACDVSGTPKTTALRWINFLIEMKLIERLSSELDQRVIFLRLSETAKQKLNAYFDTT